MRITESQLRKVVRKIIAEQVDPYGHQEDAACPQCGEERRKSFEHGGYEPCDSCGFDFEDTTSDPAPTVASPMIRR